MSGALIRFRLIAYLVGVMLLVLTVGVVLRYGFDYPALSKTVSPIHGFLYMLYLVAVYDLGRRAGWSPKRMILIMLAGTVPFMSFFAERAVTRRGIRQRATPDGTSASEPAGRLSGPAPDRSS